MIKNQPCSDCGRLLPKGLLQRHHIVPKILLKEGDVEELTEPICATCHALRHYDPEKGILCFEGIKLSHTPAAQKKRSESLRNWISNNPDKVMERAQKANLTKKGSLDRWSSKWDCCINCKTTEIEHAAKGLCNNCYMAQKRKNHKTEYSHWKEYNTSCKECHKTDHKHQGQGFCTTCYQRLRLQGKIKKILSTGKWSMLYNACKECGTTERSHQGHGMCGACNKRLKRHTKWS